MSPVMKFRLGQIMATPNALSVLSQEDVNRGISRHQSGEWGDVTAQDREANESALVEGARLWSVYHNPAGVKFWIITEADRSTTTVLLPEDY